MDRVEIFFKSFDQLESLLRWSDRVQVNCDALFRKINR